MPPLYTKCFPWLTFICILFALPILALSMINFCALILYLNAGASGSTVLFHILILVIGWYRDRPSYKSTSPRPFVAFSQVSITCCMFVLALWMVTFAVSVQLTIQGPETAKPFAAHALWSFELHMGILFLTGCICLTKGLYLHMCFLERRRFFEPLPPVDHEKGATNKPLPQWPGEPEHLKSRKGSISTISDGDDSDEGETEKRNRNLRSIADETRPRRSTSVAPKADPASLVASKVRVNLKKPAVDFRWIFVTPKEGSSAADIRGSIVRESALWD